MTDAKPTASSSLRATLIGDVVGSRRSSTVRPRTAQPIALCAMSVRARSTRRHSRSATSSRAVTPPSARRSTPRCPSVSRSRPVSMSGSASAGVRCRCSIHRPVSRTGPGGGPHARRSNGRRRRNGNRGWPWFARRFGSRASTAPTPTPAINAALLCRDHLLGSLDDRSIRIVEGLFDDSDEEGHLRRRGHQRFSVSLRAGRDGFSLIVVASQYLRGVP